MAGRLQSMACAVTESVTSSKQCMRTGRLLSCKLQLPDTYAHAPLLLLPCQGLDSSDGRHCGNCLPGHFSYRFEICALVNLHPAHHRRAQWAGTLALSCIFAGCTRCACGRFCEQTNLWRRRALGIPQRGARRALHSLQPCTLMHHHPPMRHLRRRAGASVTFHPSP